MNFRKSAMDATTLSELMSGVEKMTSEEVIEKYPNGVTLTEFDIVDTGKERYAIFKIKENKDVFFSGGMVLTKMADAWVCEYEGNIQQASADLKKDGGVKVKLTKGKTRDGQKTVTRVEVL